MILISWNWFFFFIYSIRNRFFRYFPLSSAVQRGTTSQQGSHQSLEHAPKSKSNGKQISCAETYWTDCHSPPNNSLEISEIGRTLTPRLRFRLDAVLQTILIAWGDIWAILSLIFLLSTFALCSVTWLDLIVDCFRFYWTNFVTQFHMFFVGKVWWFGKSSWLVLMECILL